MNTNHNCHDLMKDMHMTFSQLQCLVALAELKHFTEAAERVGLTQSAVSHALATLESELGITLLDRNRKGIISLTAAGQKIIPHVRALLAQAETIEQEAKLAQGLSMGKLRVGCILSFSPDLLARVLTRFQQQYPEINIVLFEGTMQEVIEWIWNSIVDVGFVLHPGKEVESTLITTDEQCVLVPSRHRLCHQSTVTVKDLRQEEFIMAKNDECLFELMKMMGLKTLPVRYHASDSATILAMVREGLGITIIPRKMLPTKLEGVAALPLNPAQKLPIGLAVKSQEMASPTAKLFIQTALTCVNTQADLVESTG
jgi:DNA-binding transcriptional LysR family regulator